jgi:hypothetical protein
MKLESLVIVDQHATVNTFSGLIHTAHQIYLFSVVLITNISTISSIYYNIK